MTWLDFTLYLLYGIGWLASVFFGLINKHYFDTDIPANDYRNTVAPNSLKKAWSEIKSINIVGTLFIVSVIFTAVISKIMDVRKESKTEFKLAYEKHLSDSTNDANLKEQRDFFVKELRSSNTLSIKTSVENAQKIIQLGDSNQKNLIRNSTENTKAFTQTLSENYLKLDSSNNLFKIWIKDSSITATDIPGFKFCLDSGIMFHYWNKNDLGIYLNFYNPTSFTCKDIFGTLYFILLDSNYNQVQIIKNMNVFRYDELAMNETYIVKIALEIHKEKTKFICPYLVGEFKNSSGKSYNFKTTNYYDVLEGKPIIDVPGVLSQKIRTFTSGLENIHKL